MKTTSIKCSQCNIEFQKPVSYIKQSKKRKYSNHFCSSKCSTSFNRNLQIVYKQNRINEYYINPKTCISCLSIIPYEKRFSNERYCSSKCSATHTQKDGGNQQWNSKNKDKLRNSIKSSIYFTNLKNKRNKVICEICKTQFETIPSIHKTICSRKCKSIWIKQTGHFKNKGRGGFRQNSGTSKKGWYKGYFCGSSWELAWLIYQLEHNISVKRNTTGFTYTFKGNIKKYYPDFIVGDEYIEIKNYETEQVIEKTKQFPHKLKLLYKKDLLPIFDYIEQKYGKNYTCLYEKKNA